MKQETQLENTLKSSIEIQEKVKSKTGFEQSLEGAQDWPPKSFKVQPYCIEDSIKFLVDRMTNEEVI